MLSGSPSLETFRNKQRKQHARPNHGAGRIIKPPNAQEAPQSPLRNTWWNDIEDSKLSVAPAQGSDEKIHSGLEWEESGKYSYAIESPMIFISPC